MYTNADCITNKIAELKARIAIYLPDIICINEIMPKSLVYELSTSTLEIEGYALYISDDTTKMKRGVIMYVSNHILCSQVYLNSDFEEFIFGKIKLSNNETCMVGCIYRSPNSTEENNQKLLELLTELNNTKTDILVITGDFNYNSINWDSRQLSCGPLNPATLIYNHINDLFLDEMVKVPTRFRENQTPTRDDWILTNTPDRISNIVISPSLAGSSGKESDHATIMFNVDTSYETLESIPKYQYYKGNYDDMNTELETTDWTNITNSWSTFENFFKGLIERHIPKKKYLSKKKPLWFNRTVRSAIKDKHKSWNKFNKNKSDTNWESYKEIRNNTCMIIKTAKMEFEDKITNEIKGNPKTFWNYVNSKSGSKTSMGDLLGPNGETIENEQEKANILNTYFNSVFTKEDLTTSPAPDPLTLDSIITSIEVNEETVLKHLSKLNTSKSAGPDNIHPKILFETRFNLKTPICTMYKNSLKDGKIPTEWKLGHVIPLFKKDSRKLPSNFRPVSLTAVCCKILEKIIRNKIINHLELNKIFHNDQHGFRNGRSCQTQLLEVMEIWSAIFDNNQNWDCMYLDFAKAFDSVPHERLLKKM